MVLGVCDRDFFFGVVLFAGQRYQLLPRKTIVRSNSWNKHKRSHEWQEIISKLPWLQLFPIRATDLICDDYAPKFGTLAKMPYYGTDPELD